MLELSLYKSTITITNFNQIKGLLSLKGKINLPLVNIRIISKIYIRKGFWVRKANTRYI